MGAWSDVRIHERIAHRGAQFPIPLRYLARASNHMRHPPMNEGLSQVPPKLLDGREPFHGPGAGQSLQLLDYWRWSSSSLLDNTNRGILAEFLVSVTLDLHKEPRIEWQDYDLQTASGRIMISRQHPAGL